MTRLSDIAIRHWIKNNDHFDMRSDGGGLNLRYRREDKHPTWHFRYQVARKGYIIKIGRYPDMTLAEARKETQLLQAKLTLGINPVLEKRHLKAKLIEESIAANMAHSVADLVDEFFERKMKSKSAPITRQRVDKYLIPAIGKLAIDAVKPLHIDTMLQAILKAGAPTTANDILSITKRIFDYAVTRHHITINPASAFKFDDAGGKEQSRKRFLSERELVLLFESMRYCEEFSRTHYLLVKLLLLLCCRKGELLGAKIADFDLDRAVWHLSEDNKTKAKLIVPLPAVAVEAIRELLTMTMVGNDYLIPARAPRKIKNSPVDVGFLNKPVRCLLLSQMGNIEPFTIHDFRRTARSHLAELGIEDRVAERCLNHLLPGVQGIYDRYDYFEERRHALDRWANKLTSLENGQDWNVTPMRKPA